MKTCSLSVLSEIMVEADAVLIDAFNDYIIFSTEHFHMKLY